MHPLSGFAVCFYGSIYDNLDRLDTSESSARELAKVLWMSNGQPGALLLSEYPHCVQIKKTEQFKKDLWRFSRSADQRDSRALFCYFVGHGYSTLEGDQYLYSSDSDPDTPLSGVSLEAVVRILAGQRPKHLILAFDTCRISRGPLSLVRRSISEGPLKLQLNFQSLAIILSAMNGTDAMGGDRQRRKSPFSEALSGVIRDPYLRLLPRTRIQEKLSGKLGENHRNTKLLHSYPEVIFQPDGDLTLLASVPSSLQPAYEPKSSGELIRISELFRKTILRREARSFEEDRYLRDSYDCWSIKFVNGPRQESAELYLVDNLNPLIVMGGSGSGKTTLAKLVALRISEQEFKGRFALYINASKLDNHDHESFCSSVLNYIFLWRYHAGEQLSQRDLVHLFEIHHFTFLIDCIEEVRDYSKLKDFVQGSCELGNPVVFCQPHDHGMIADIIRSPALQILKIKPISVNSLDMLSFSEKRSVEETLWKETVPLDLQVLLSYRRDKGQLPRSQLDMAEYTLERMQILLSNALRKSNYIGLRTTLGEGEFSFDESPVRRLVKVFAIFAEEIRSRSYFLQFSEEIAIEAFQQSLMRCGLSPSAQIARLLLDVGCRSSILRQTEGPRSPVRFYHQRDQELLIALSWFERRLSDDELILFSRSYLWENVLPAYGRRIAPARLPFTRITEVNPFAASLCLAEGIPFGNEDLLLVGNGLLNHCSEWSRGRAMRSLSKLPSAVSEWLCDRYQRSSNLDERVTIALSLGLADGEFNLAFLRRTLANTWPRPGRQASYLRRRILDALKGHLDLDLVEPLLSVQRPTPREWVRVVRSLHLQSTHELSRLQAVSHEVCGQRVRLIEAYLLFQEYRLTKSDHLIFSIGSHCDYALASKTKWHRCLAALLIDDAGLSQLAGRLYEALESERDPHAVGDMAFVLGGICRTIQHVALLFDLCETIDRRFFPPLSQRRVQELLNDVLLGLERASKSFPSLRELIPESLTRSRRQAVLRVLETAGQ